LKYHRKFTFFHSERYSVNLRQILSLGYDGICHKPDIAITDAVTLTYPMSARFATYAKTHQTDRNLAK